MRCIALALSLALLPQPVAACPDPRPAVVRAEAARDPQAYFSQYDYPVPALAAGAEGEVAVKLSVGDNGRVTACTVTASSGSLHLDSTTCRILRSRARFTPARDANAKPTIDSTAATIVWRRPAA